MAKYNLNVTGNVNIQTTFRYELFFPENALLGLTDSITAFCTSAQLPRAMINIIEWHMPMGMINHQAGKGVIQPIPVEFVISSSSTANAISMFEKWRQSSYSLNRGTNRGKGIYCVDGIAIKLKSENDITKHTFRLLRTQVSDLDYGTVGSETGDLLKASGTLVYDDYEYYDANGTKIELL